MKFPSLSRIPKNKRFNFEPRYYDPIKEDIQNRTERIDVVLGVQGQTPLGFSRTVAQSPGHPAMGEFVKGQGHEQGYDLQQDQSDIHSKSFSAVNAVSSDGLLYHHDVRKRNVFCVMPVCTV